MNILAALRQAEAKLQKQADKVRQQLNAVRAARKILGREVASSGKRIGKKMSDRDVPVTSCSILSSPLGTTTPRYQSRQLDSHSLKMKRGIPTPRATARASCKKGMIFSYLVGSLAPLQLHM